MKRNEVNRKALEDLGYRAFCCCRGNGVYSNELAVPSRTDETFDAVVRAAREGRPVHIVRKPLLGEVHVYIPSLNENYRGSEICFYLSRPMRDDERTSR